VTITPGFKSGYVSLVGWPNVGKSTLLNSLLDSKLAIVSPKPQTTRDTTLGILNTVKAQAIFVDTPGWLRPEDTFQSVMKRAINRSIYDDADILVWIVEPRLLTEHEAVFGQNLLQASKPICVVINKVDLGEPKGGWAPVEAQLKSILGATTPVLRLSAQKGEGLDALKSTIERLLPESPPYYPTDQITDRWERFYVAELIREQIFALYHQEVPHASAVLIDEFVEAEGRKDHIAATIYVETDGQLGIIVGDQGAGVKRLGQLARAEIEARLDREVHLELRVKVRKAWRKDGEFLKRLQSNDGQVY